MTSSELLTSSNCAKDLRKYSSAKRKTSNQWFFKTDDGCYSAHDKFIGVSVPNTRKVAKIYADLPLVDVKELLYSEIHEDRLCALIILVNKYKNTDLSEQEKIVKFYLKHKKYVNNWDLVDASAHYILGQYILDHPKERVILDKLVVSKSLWDRRIAIVSTWIINREGKISETLYLSKQLLSDEEDLIHKAVGWMLREAWKKDAQRVENFLKDNYVDLPRTTLRYAIERMEEKKRRKFLKGAF